MIYIIYIKDIQNVAKGFEEAIKAYRSWLYINLSLSGVCDVCWLLEVLAQLVWARS
jgi:hypothetical protein